MAFAGKFFTKEIETESRYNVVKIEVSFVSNRCNNDKGIRTTRPLDNSPQTTRPRPSNN